MLHSVMLRLTLPQLEELHRLAASMPAAFEADAVAEAIGLAIDTAECREEVERSRNEAWFEEQG